MLVSAYDAFVQRTDQTVGFPEEDRLDVAIYGVAAEVGSVISAIKKRLLAHAGSATWNTPNAEIIEELGDVIWYCFSLARIANPRKPINILAHDIANLKREIGAGDARGERIRNVLDPSKSGEFLAAAGNFPSKARRMVFEDYQRLAFLTARTRDRTLAEVCLVVLQQLSAQLLRPKLPDVERELNTAIVDRTINDILGELAWHISALASLFGLELSDIAEANVAKVSDRWDREARTDLHDDTAIAKERLPRHFQVAFVTIGPGLSRMYMDNRRLGDDLTDNAHRDDGYRFHDVMHLANAAKLGWSPVLRTLMKRKRKEVPKIDEVEDGARAQIVEEAVIKAIHAEGERLAGLRCDDPMTGPVRLFSSSAEISFSLLKSIRNLVSGLEVAKNRYSEWEAAILVGYKIFHQLREAGQGTVTVDLDSRSLTFDREVAPALIARVQNSLGDDAPGAKT